MRDGKKLSAVELQRNPAIQLLRHAKISQVRTVLVTTNPPAKQAGAVTVLRVSAGVKHHHAIKRRGRLEKLAGNLAQSAKSKTKKSMPKSIAVSRARTPNPIVTNRTMLKVQDRRIDMENVRLRAAAHLAVARKTKAQRVEDLRKRELKTDLKILFCPKEKPPCFTQGGFY
jgi:hypothetical protein